MKIEGFLIYLNRNKEHEKPGYNIEKELCGSFVSFVFFVSKLRSSIY